MEQGKGKKIVWAAVLMGIVVLCCAVMAVIDGVLHLPYFVKSGIKVTLFVIGPILFCYFQKVLSRADTLKPLFRTKKKTVGIALGLGIGLYGLILGAYFLLRGVFDFSGITKSLTQNVGVTKQIFPLVAVYISIVNSFLEEFFFRGFAFLLLKKLLPKQVAHIFSAFVFALYHVAMMIGWFSVPVFLLALAGLVAGGLIFNVLCDKGQGIYPSWALHMFANFAINTVGFLLFDMV